MLIALLQITGLRQLMRVDVSFSPSGRACYTFSYPQHTPDITTVVPRDLSEIGKKNMILKANYVVLTTKPRG